MAMRFARFKEMKERGYFANRMAAWRAVRNGFPAAYELGPNSIAWDLDEAEAYVAKLPRRIPGKQTPQPPTTSPTFARRPKGRRPPPPESRRRRRHERNARSPAAGGADRAQEMSCVEADNFKNNPPPSKSQG
jgi:predicted DNA-binding transcriptional regulator AlpA